MMMSAIVEVTDSIDTDRRHQSPGTYVYVEAQSSRDDLCSRRSTIPIWRLQGYDDMTDTHFASQGGHADNPNFADVTEGHELLYAMDDNSRTCVEEGEL